MGFCCRVFIDLFSFCITLNGGTGNGPPTDFCRSRIHPMTENGRFLPPSERRVAAAAGQGVFPRSRSLVAGACCLALAGVGFGFRDAVGDGFLTLFARGIGTTVRRDVSLVDAFLQTAKTAMPLGIALVVAPLFAAILTAVLPALYYRRRHGRTAVPVPPVRGGRLEMTMLRVFGVAVFIASTAYIVRGARISCLDPVTAARSLSILLLKILAVLGGVLILVGGAALLIRRGAILNALKLNRQEAQRERIMTEGNKTLVSTARRRAGREATK